MARRLTALGGILGGAALGAGLMYFLDPERGRRRRAGVRDTVSLTARGVECGIHSLAGRSRDARNRAFGLLAEARKKLRREAVDDEILEARIRSTLGHKIPHPGWVDVKVDHGCVSLGGHVEAAHAAAMLSCVSSVKGVKGVDDHVEVQ